MALILVTRAAAVRADGAAAPPPMALTCQTSSECPSGAMCSTDGVCVEASPLPVPPPVSAILDVAKQHFDQGVALFNDNNFPAALAEFLESYRLNPAAAVLRNIGYTQQRLFRYPEAIETLKRYLAGSPAIAADERANTDQIIAEMQALLAPVTLSITPAGASVTVDGRVLGRAPFTLPLQLAAGTHTLEIVAAGFTPEHRELGVVAGTPAQLSLALVAIPRTGKVRIAASVAGAVVAIDGAPAGIAPLEVELGPGGHSLEISAPHFQTRREELVVTAGETRVKQVTLDALVEARPRRWYQRWYVWTPVAVVVSGVGLGAAIHYGTTEGPITGTLSPGVQTIK